MRNPRSNLSSNRLVLAILAGAVIILGAIPAFADIPQGRLNRDLTVGANHDVQLKANQTVQVMKDAGGKAVIMVALPDGSNGVFQIDAAAVDLTAPTVSAPAAPSVAPAPVAVAAPVVATPPLKPSPPPVVAKEGPPTYPDDFVGGPEFTTIAGKQAAGTASVVKLRGGTQSYIVSARHLLGPMGGFARQTPAEKVPEFVKSIDIASFSGGRHRYEVSGLLVPAKALKPLGGPPINDMTIFLNHDKADQPQAVALADALPAVGAPLWVVAHVAGGVPEGEIMHSAKVTSTDGWIVIQFDNDNIVTAGASGAPVLDAAGEVVGVYSGHSDQDGHKLGFIIPAPLIAKVIRDSGT